MPEPGLGLVTVVQAVPSQCRINVSVAVPLRLSYDPTAQALLLDTAVTP